MNSHAVDRKKWFKLSIFDQMGNISSEVGRSFNAQKMQNLDMTQNAVIRALDLFDATAENLSEIKSPKLYEVLRARELFAQAIINENPDKSLENYFMQFAIAARLRKTS